MQASGMKERLEQVADRIPFASMNYRIWRIYTARNDRAKYLGVLRTYNSFFLTSLRAHFVAAITTLYGLYEMAWKHQLESSGAGFARVEAADRRPTERLMLYQVVIAKLVSTRFDRSPRARVDRPRISRK